MTADLTALTVAEMRDALRRGDVSSVDLTKAHLARIEQIDPSVKSYLTVTPEVAEAQAKKADDRRAAGESGDQLGIPMALKDVFTTRDIRTTAGSKMLESFLPIEDGTMARRLAEA